ncbi:TPM domain-containing protein [Georgenia sp. AZ-5]|uniref:TPM domain-containing protein n=1 Tax=Georgenia sp. AZ-5 TaxID=3367526 RepID=UPI0037547DEC
MRLVAAARSAVVAVLVALPAVALAGPAAAEPPQQLTEQVTDSAGVLESGDAEEIQQTIEQVQADTGQLVYVTFVDDFDELTNEVWAEETATASGLGPNNVLLAVGMDISQYGLGRHSSSPVDFQELQGFTDQEVAPLLGAGDWAGAATTFAEGVGELATGGNPAGDGGGGFFGTVLIIGVIAIVAVGAFLVLRRKKQEAARPAGPQRTLPRDHPLNLPTPELAKRAGTALVGADDAIRSSEEELGFAKAQFGLQATDAFTAALAQAKTKAQRAFYLRQQLDDDVPETEPQQREMYAEILQLTDDINATLKAQADQFAKLRNMQARAPQILDELEQRAGEVARQIESARVELAQLATRYPAGALASVSKNPDQAKALLDSARRSVQDGRAKVEADDRATAVTHARVAEEAIGQADTLLKNVHGAGRALAEAGSRLDAAIASITADVRDANRLAPRDPVVVARRKEAEAAIALGQQAREGGDPLAAIQRLTAAESAIDAALAPARETDENNRRAAAQLYDRLGRLDSQIRAVSDYIATRRGTVGSDARTRLSEAERLAHEAHRLARTEPMAALEAVARAEQMAGDAQRLAERDAERYDDFAGYGGGFGGFGGPRRGGIDVGSLILGGILLGGGHHGGGWGGGFGGGGGGFGGGGGDFGGGGFDGGGGGF